MVKILQWKTEKLELQTHKEELTDLFNLRSSKWIKSMNIVLLEWNSHTIERYRQEIRKYLGYRISTIHDQTRVIDYLIDHFVPQYLPDRPGTKDGAKNAESNRKILYILFVNILRLR